MRVACVAVALTCCSLASPRAQSVPVVQEVTLAEAIDVALTRAPATVAARADVAIARAAKSQASLRSNPTFSVERRQEPGGTDDATEIGVEWPLELFRLAPRVAVASAELAVAEHEEADFRRQLVGDVAAAYGSVAAATRELATTDEVLGTATAQVDLLRARAAEGAAPSLDRDIVEVELWRMRAERMRQAAQADQAFVRLKQLLGLAPDAPLRLRQSLEQLVTDVDAQDARGEPRPDVRAAEARVRAADERLLAARSRGKPDVTLFGSYSRVDAGFPQHAFSNAGGLERVRGQFNNVAAGAMVTVPLWNREQGTIAAAMAAREASEARAEMVRQAAASEVAQARVFDEQAQRVIVLYQQEVRPLARRNRDIVREAYQLGRVTVFDVIAEQRRYLDAERAYTAALADAFAARVNLRRAMGHVR